MKGYCGNCEQIRNSQQSSYDLKFYCNLCGKKVKPLLAAKNHKRERTRLNK